jgi:AraC-like DNA-binding protein
MTTPTSRVLMSQASTVKVLQHPYHEFEDLSGGRAGMREAAGLAGSALVWVMGDRGNKAHADLLRTRPGGLALLVILPRPEQIEAEQALVPMLTQCRPAGYLPHHHGPEPSDLAQVLRRPPSDLAADVTDYLRWRGLVFDRDTLHLLRQIIDLSKNVRTVEGLARGLYVSRRALGRRLTSRGLPVPSHWLQVARLIRLSTKLQNSQANLFSIACASGYPDGFSVSNQMSRMLGTRPSIVREHLGWEWVFEAWLRSEAESGGLAPTAAREIASGPRSGPTSRAAHPRSTLGRPRRKSRK